MSANLSPILIVDDEKDNLEALQRLLRTEYAVSTTVSPFEALKWVQSTEYHVIISDQRMPEMTGVELLEKTKKLSPVTTRILLTGYTDIASVIDAINRGNIYRYIAKPWDPNDFKITLKQADEAFRLRKELEEKNVELSKAVDELKGLDKAKSRFLSLVSHELNTPLTVLNSFITLLGEEKKGLSPELQKYIGSITEASNRFSEIVAEVLVYLKLTSGTALSKREGEILPILSNLSEGIQKEADKKKLKLKKVCEKTLKHVLDAEHFKILLERVLSDAIARAKPNSEIQIEAKKSNGHLSLALSRTGEPIDSSAFQPLEVAANQMHHQKNLGLSLATAKLVVDSHQGKITPKTMGDLQVLEISIP